MSSNKKYLTARQSVLVRIARLYFDLLPAEKAARLPGGALVARTLGPRSLAVAKPADMVIGCTIVAPLIVCEIDKS